MADTEQNHDPSQKTEEATEHRIQQALEQGQIPISRELNGWALTLSLWVLVGLVFPYFGWSLLKKLSVFFSETHQFVLTPLENPFQKIIPFILGFPIGTTLFLWLLIPCLGVILVGGLQTQWRISLKSLTPQWERLSPLQGFKKIFGLRAWVEFSKTLLKLTLLALACAWLLHHQAPQYASLLHLSVPGIARVLYQHLNILMLLDVILMGGMAGLDVLYQRFQWRKNLRMSKQELKDEYKQTEGDPVIKGRLRSIRQERSKKRMMAVVPQATVVVMNPTHYAVALKYDAATMDAPQVIAKGMDFLALTIRDIAKEHKIPIIQDAPLARSLYQDVPLDQMIPEKHYQAVAKLIRLVMNLKPSS